MLHIRKLNQYYGESHTLWNLSLSLKENRCTAIMGRNGVGKTTLIKSIMGLLEIESGYIELDGKRIDHLKSDIRAKLGIGYVPQGREIFPQLTVEENLRIALEARVDNSKEIPTFIFDLFPVLKDMSNRQGGNLSGGQQQQLAIARALATDPKVLLLDEATEGVQPNIVEEIKDIIKYINQEKDITVLLVTLRMDLAKSICDDFYLIDRGRTVAHGNISELTYELRDEFLVV